MSNTTISQANKYLINNEYELAVLELQQLIYNQPKTAYYYSSLSLAYDGLHNDINAYFSNVQWALLSDYKLADINDRDFFYQFNQGRWKNKYFNPKAILIVVPVFNAEGTIKECIQSLFNQSYKDIVVIAVDDYSNDNSARVLKELEAIYPNLYVLLSPKNLGTYNAINLALYTVRNFEFGYFCIHGADDMMHTRKLELQILQMDSKKALGCIAGYSRVDINTKKVLKSSNRGHSMAVFNRKVFDKIGYYYDSRFGSDSEYWQRFIHAFGVENSCAVTKPLTNAYFGSDNLTQSNHDKSEKRLELVKAYTELHTIMNVEQNWFVDFDIFNKISSDEKKVICGLATIPGRKDALRETVHSILSQVDKLIVYQNGFNEIYDYLNHEKIEVISSLETGIDMGDAGKFYQVKNYPNHYYFSIDDDLIYPHDYVTTMINKLRSYNNSIIVTLHGRVLKSNAKSYYKDISENYRCLDAVKEDSFVHFGGTGVMAFDTSKFEMSFNICKAPNMADIWVGLEARSKDVPILVVKHKEGWLKYSDKFDHNETIYRAYKSKHGIQDRLIQRYDTSFVTTPKKDTKAKYVADATRVKKRVVFLTCTYKRENVTKIFKHSLLRLQRRFLDDFEFINIVIDSESTNKDVFLNDPQFKYYEYSNLPISNKWSFGIQRLKHIEFDYVFIIGSDNTIEDTVFYEYKKHIDKDVDIIGMTDMYIYSLERDELYYWRGYPKKHKRYGETIGLGRCFSKKVIENMDYQLWDEGLNKGLDGNMTRKIDSMINESNHKFTKAKFSIRNVGIACDIKGGFNISQFEDFLPNSTQINDKNIVENYKTSLYEGDLGVIK